MKKEEYIAKAEAVYGKETYDYSLLPDEVKMISGAENKISIICPKHGKFEQNPCYHTSGNGCKECGKLKVKNKKTMEFYQFLELANKQHNNKYDYSKVDMYNRDEKGRICIVCHEKDKDGNEHGEFWQKPKSHLRGCGCIKCCIANRKLTNNQVVEKLKSIYGDKFLYDKINYIDNSTDIILICSKCHKQVVSSPHHALYEKTLLCNNCDKWNKENFISESIKKFGNKCDYENINFINMTTKIHLKCNDCGYEFDIEPHYYLDLKNGCPNCAKIKKSALCKERLIKINHNCVMWNKERFIQESKKIHGENKFNYDNCDYVNLYTPVILKCNDCGDEFKIIPANHIYSQSGCKKCHGVKPYTQESFLEAIMNLHKNKNYDFSKVVFKGLNNTIDIKCNDCNNFFHPLASSMLYQAGECPICSGKFKRDTKLIIDEFKKVHGDEYLYDRVNYLGTDIPVEIGCKKHGYFWQSPYNHKNGCKCPKCANGVMTTEEFIEKANKIHNYKYIYSKIEYVDLKTKISIVCPIHGEFIQAPFTHLKGSGCLICARNKKKKTTEEFVEISNKVHNNKYDYSKVDMYNRDEKGRVCIICSEHGEFWQKPKSHLRGCGCPQCQPNYKITTEEFIKRAKEIHN